MCIQGHALSHYDRFKAPINLQHRVRGTPQPPLSLLHFYVYDSFKTNYKANNTAMLQNMASPRLLFIMKDMGEMSAKRSAVTFQSSM